MNVLLYNIRVKAVQFKSDAPEQEKGRVLNWINGNSLNQRTVATIEDGAMYLYTHDEFDYLVNMVKVSDGEWLVKLTNDVFRVYSKEEFEYLTTAIPSSYTYVKVVGGPKQQ